MRVDASALAAFYASSLGEAARSMLSRRVNAIWESVAGLDALGFGFVAPLVQDWREHARRVALASPAGQGALCWPPGAAGLSVLCEERRMPFMDAVFDRVVLAHALEESDDPRGLLREVWRVMAPEGRIIVIAPNRLSLWAVSDATPFGNGRPYSRRQLAGLLTDCLFEPTASARAVYAPPIAFKPLAKAAGALEAAGERLWPAFGGLILMEAVKRLEARSPAPEARVIRAAAWAGARVRFGGDQEAGR
jgi:SAM-dependent methyltransferase